MNRKQTVHILANLSEGLAVDSQRLACEAADQPGGSLAEGVRVACGPAVGHAEAGDAALFFTVMADDSAPESADIVLRLVGDRPSDEPWAYVTVNAKFSDASPRLEVSPDQMDTGVVRGESVSETLSLKNTGYEKMENVRIRLTDADGEPAPDWIMPSGEKSLGDIEIGETKQSGIVCSPTDSTPEGLRDITLRIASDNHPEALIGVRVAVVQSGTGSALVKVSDIYTGTVDPDTSRTIEGLSGASVVLQNEAVATEVYTARTDDAGEALFSDIPAGLYACRVSADGHNPHSGTVKIRPGVTASESVFLMNRLVTVEWSVTETTIEDKYEIEAVATFETDVPAPVVVFEPAGIVLPSGMKAGDVHRGEFAMTNMGLVRAESIRFELPENDPYFQFETRRRPAPDPGGEAERRRRIQDRLPESPRGRRLRRKRRRNRMRAIHVRGGHPRRRRGDLRRRGPQRLLLEPKKSRSPSISATKSTRTATSRRRSTSGPTGRA